MSETLDDILGEIELPNNDLVPTNEQPKEVALVPEKTEDELINLTLQKNDELETLANNAFNVFYENIVRGTDHSQASKEQMLEALKVRVEINKIIADLAKSKRKQVDKLGVMINTVSPMQAGINISNIKDNI